MRHFAATLWLSFITIGANAHPVVDTYFAPIYTISLTSKTSTKKDIDLIQSFSPASKIDAFGLIYSSFITDDGYRYIFRFQTRLGRFSSIQLFVVDARNHVEELKIVSWSSERGYDLKIKTETFKLESGAIIKIAAHSSSISLPAMQESVTVPSKSKCIFALSE